jgi:cyclophilin family peptidyl-prolyl cis-trans isomerase
MKRFVLRLCAGFSAFSMSLCLASDVVVLQFQRQDQLSAPVVIELLENRAPLHAANFKKLASKGFYHKTRIHRILPEVLVQMGDPLSRKKDTGDLGTGGPGYTLPAEIHAKHVRGAVAMGRMNDSINPRKLSNGSQFYICLDAQPDLDGKYTVFGKVVQGLEVLQGFSTHSTDSNDTPVVPVYLVKTRVVSPADLQKTLSSMPVGKKIPWWQTLYSKLPLRWPF